MANRYWLRGQTKNGFDVTIALVGQSKVGKTSLVKALTNEFDWKQVPTKGVDETFFTWVSPEGKRIELRVLDFGFQRWNVIQNKIISEADGVILCFDHSQPLNDEYATLWIEPLRHHVPLVICGTKSDKANRIDDRVKLIAKHFDIPLVSTSAKENVGVQKPFSLLLK